MTLVILPTLYSRRMRLSLSKYFRQLGRL